MAERVVELPQLASVYRTAVATTASRALSRRRPKDLPDTVLVAKNVSLSREADRRLREEAGGRGGESASAEYLHVLAFPLAMEIMAGPDFPLPVLGMVHIENRVEHLRAVPFDEKVTVRAFADRLRAHPAGTAVDLVVEIECQGEVAFRGVSTNLARGVKLCGDVERGPREEIEFAGRTAQWRFPADTGRRWAAVSGDYNPIHLSSLSAKALGMKTSIAHGMLLASKALESALPAGVESGYVWEIKFLTPVLLPSTVDVRFEVERADAGAVKAVDYRGWGSRSGKPHFTGRVTVTGSESRPDSPF